MIEKLLKAKRDRHAYKNKLTFQHGSHITVIAVSDYNTGFTFLSLEVNVCNDCTAKYCQNRCTTDIIEK